MFENNKITQLLGIKYPVIQGGMAGISESKLVSAVSNAGGLGVIGAGVSRAEWLEQEIKKTKELTNKPFGVNLLMSNPKISDLLKLIIKNKIQVVFTGGGNPLSLFPYLKKAGIKIIPVVALVRLAKKMEDEGADAVVVEGTESGGHIGKSTTFSLIPQTKKEIKNIPIIGAGGIYDSKTAKASFILGADGVQIGTRFLASKESQIQESYKKAILEAKDEDIIVVARFTGHPIRVIKNKWTERIKELEEKTPFPEELSINKFAGSNLKIENVDNIPMLCGLSAGGISEIKSCEEIIQDIISELI